MNILQLKQWIKDNLLNKNNQINSNRTKDNSKFKLENEHIFDLILETTSFLNYDDKITLNGRIYSILEDITEKLYCKTCGKELYFKNNKSLYGTYCNKTCAVKDDEANKIRNAKAQNTKKKRKKLGVYDEQNHRSNRHITNKKDWNDINWWVDNSENGVMMLSHAELAKYFNIQGTSSIYKKIRNYGLKYKPNKRSDEEMEVFEYTKSVYDEIEYSIRHILTSTRELDIYSEKHNLAIEYNGLAFHTSWDKETEIKQKNRHLNKTIECEEKGIQLLHIFSNEWIDNQTKQDIWKSVIKNKLGFIENKIYARKCIIKEVDSKEASKFLENNHLQGKGVSKYRYGLYYKDELASLMTFSNSRYNKNYDYELIRFCTKLDHVVVGGFSKLLKYFRSNHKGSIISYANRRWSNGSVYEKNGFKFIQNTNPNYFYTKNNRKLESRVKYQKHKLKDMLENFDESLTETENMYNHGYRKIYDCGNKVYILE